MTQFTSSGIVDGKIADRFGKFSVDLLDGIPTRSLPLVWSGLPVGTKSITIVMQDYDAVPVCGFSWIHWLVVDIDPSLGWLPEDASRKDDSLIQWMNSLISRWLPDSLTHYYGWPRPPDRDHEYEIRLFALDTVLGLPRGFRYNELVRAMRGHILAESATCGWYSHLES